jgi:hypothetical protein
MALAIEGHPEHRKIIDAILAGKPVRVIAASVTPPVSYMAVQRYRSKVVAPALANSATLSKVLTAQGFNAVETLSTPNVTDVTRAALQADPILQRIAAHRQTVDSKIIEAQPAGAAALISADLRGLELEARLTGRLDSAAPTTQINIVGPITIDQRHLPADYSGEVIDLTASK